ncbi:hypothetical protein [Falsiroseomonas stagni]|uniref:Uncharacterized protein n=1 Tax=Falsiroseomonas stagni DSM 19981 TaxID=1123062 RepID=A0A1I4DTX6_9PROT|nr:hypothetical protein [Falsiroseomonas stagni]SFK96110.1 hypothetical protein SAMN02745775_11255 [Falsiroseomonas stagni DSM 19981]
MTIPGNAERGLRAALADAPDHALGRVVAMLDALRDRSEVDILLDGIRPRLRRLRPQRPVRLGRLLCLPLEGVLVNPGSWRQSPLLVPRSAIRPITAAVAVAVGEIVVELEVLAAGGSLSDEALVQALGERLWPAAGRATLPIPPQGWSEAGLPDDSAAPMLALCGAIWRHAPALWAAAYPGAREGGSETEIRAALAPLAGEGRAALLAGLALLLRDATRPGVAVCVAGSLMPSVQPTAEQELAAALTRDGALVAGAASPGEMASAAQRLVRRMEGLEATDNPMARDQRRQLALTLRREVGAACYTLYDRALAEGLLAEATRIAAGPPATDEQVAMLERMARDLRRLEVAGRRLAAEAAFDRTLADTIGRLLPLAASRGGLARVEVARLVEMLAGPQAALPLLEG